MVFYSVEASFLYYLGSGWHGQFVATKFAGGGSILLRLRLAGQYVFSSVLVSGGPSWLKLVGCVGFMTMELSNFRPLSALLIAFNWHL